MYWSEAITPVDMGEERLRSMNIIARLTGSVYSEKENIKNGENPCKISFSAVFLCSFVACLSLKSVSRNKGIINETELNYIFFDYWYIVKNCRY